MRVMLSPSAFQYALDKCYNIECSNHYRNDAEGGENMVVDMWAVAERLRKDHPKYFKTLTTSRGTFQQDRSGTET